MRVGCIKSRTKHKPSYALHARLTIVIHAWLPKNSTMPLSSSNYLSLYEALAFAKCIDNIIVMTLIFVYTYIIYYMINRLKRWSRNQDNIYLCILCTKVWEMRSITPIHHAFVTGCCTLRVLTDVNKHKCNDNLELNFRTQPFLSLFSFDDSDFLKYFDSRLFLTLHKGYRLLHSILI